MKISSYFKNAGGLKMIKLYISNHVLGYAILLFLFIKKNRKGLELFRECINAKIFNKLEKKYHKKVINYSKEISNSDTNTIEKRIWICWLQGIEKAPEIVKTCYKSICAQCHDFEIILLTEKNLFEYTNIPDFIINKWKAGIITNTHFSDIIRNNVLVLHGGFCIDSTVLLTSRIPSDIQKLSLFLFKTYKPGCDGKFVSISSWFLGACKMNPVFLLSQKLLWDYWKKATYLCDYFLFHDFLQMSLNHYVYLDLKIPKYSNETPHFMLFELENEFDPIKFESYKNQSFAHKLTYKLKEGIEQNPNCTYRKVIKLYE